MTDQGWETIWLASYGLAVLALATLYLVQMGIL